MTQEEIDRKRGRIVPWVIAAFYVAFVSAFIGFVVIAFNNPPNEVTAEAYQKGLAYNRTLDKAAVQDQLGWTSDTAYENGRVVFSLRDADGQPLPGAVARAWFVHPNLKANDRSVDLKDNGHGIYAATIALPAEGLWKVHVTAEHDGRQYQSATLIEAQ